MVLFFSLFSIFRGFGVSLFRDFDISMFRCFEVSWLLGESVLAEVVDGLSVHVVHPLAGDVALQVAALVEHGQPVGLGALEGFHHLVHGRVVIEDGVGLGHQLRGREVVVQFGAEHDVAYLQDVDFAQQEAGGVGHGQHRTACAADLVDHLAQFHVGVDGLIVAVDDRVEAHQGEHGVVGMVGDQLSLPGQSHTVDAVWLEDDDGQVTGDGDNHQRHEHVVAAGNLGNEEDARQRGVHDAGHDAGHAQQGEVLLGHVDACSRGVRRGIRCSTR